MSEPTSPGPTPPPPTLVPPTPAEEDRPFPSRTVLKMVGIGALTLIMLIPLALTLPVVSERMERRDDAVRSIQSGWGNRQTLVGPVLVLPYLPDPSLPTARVAFVLPESFSASGVLEPQSRWRGIFEGVVFNARVTLSGTFRIDLGALGIAKETVFWDQAYLAIGLSDLRGVAGAVHVEWQGEQLKLRPGSRLADWPSGLHVPVKAAPGTVLEFRAELPFRGSVGLDVAPVGSTSHVELRSSWPHPSFVGAYLPESREVGPGGFRAEWRASEYGRQLPAQWVDGDGPGLRALGSSMFGVDLLMGIDAYRSVERATKYGILIVVLVFMTFFLFEVLAGAQIHPFQYGLVGLGIALFFVLLLALSEVLSFQLAYAAAAGGIVLLLSLYMLSVLRSQRRALICTVGLSACFGLLYVILQAEDYALLAGSFALFAALALLMRLTRKIDWYARDAAEKR